MTQKVLITMPERFLFDVDKVAEKEHRTRSGLIREALRTYINRQKVFDRIIAEKNASIIEELIG